MSKSKTKAKTTKRAGKPGPAAGELSDEALDRVAGGVGEDPVEMKTASTDSHLKGTISTLSKILDIRYQISSLTKKL